MKPNRALAGAMATLTLSAVPVAAGEHASRIEASRSAVTSFAASLKGELQAAMKAGGPVKAIAACNERAPAIAAQQSARHGLEIGRTSLRLRNPDNAPDAWERAALEDFERRRAAGEDPASLVRHEVIEAGGRREFRFMKAIPTAEVCLACHGSDIAPEVAARLDALYPDDAARGFSVGELRGAFTVRIPM